MDYVPQDVIDVVLDYYKQGFTGFEILKLTREHYPHLSEKTMLKIINKKNNIKEFTCMSTNDLK